MKCECGSRATCIETRAEFREGREVYRCFKCNSCGELIYTIEKPISILNKDFRQKWEDNARWKKQKLKNFQDAYAVTEN